MLSYMFEVLIELRQVVLFNNLLSIREVGLNLNERQYVKICLWDFVPSKALNVTFAVTETNQRWNLRN